jgi:LPXTG-motif cell wall-anchored protein
MRWPLGFAVVAMVIVFASATAAAQEASPPRYDLSVSGAKLTGAVGATYRVSVGVHNLGPESTAPPDVEVSARRLVAVELPEGTQVVGSVASCEPAIVAPADPRRFTCLLDVMNPGQSRPITFDMKITAPVTGIGAVSTRAFGPGTDLDTNSANDTAPITITSVPGYDIAVTGASVAAKVGSVVQVRVGLKNLGPDTAQASGGSGADKHVWGVRLPGGVELVWEGTYPCAPLNLSPPGPEGFSCVIHGLAVDESIQATFKVRITAVPAGSGTVSRGFSGINDKDLDFNKDNDRALITFTIGELPQTGTDAKMIAGIGAGTAVLGGLLLLVMRRAGSRRDRRLRSQDGTEPAAP